MNVGREIALIDHAGAGVLSAPKAGHADAPISAELASNRIPQRAPRRLARATVTDASWRSS
jgi:hypothetical protein